MLQAVADSSKGKARESSFGEEAVNVPHGHREIARWVLQARAKKATQMPRQVP